MDQPDLNMARPGEDEITDIRPSDKLSTPVDDKDKLDFIAKAKALFADTELGSDVEEHMDVLFTVLAKEMVERREAQNAVGIYNQVYEAFNKEFPVVEIDNFVAKDDPNRSMFETMFKAFEESQAALHTSIGQATKFFNNACALCYQIEQIFACEERTQDVKNYDVQVALTQLINLHKGIDSAALGLENVDVKVGNESLKAS